MDNNSAINVAYQNLQTLLKQAITKSAELKDLQDNEFKILKDEFDKLNKDHSELQKKYVDIRAYDRKIITPLGNIEFAMPDNLLLQQLMDSFKKLIISQGPAHVLVGLDSVIKELGI